MLFKTYKMLLEEKNFFKSFWKMFLTLNTSVTFFILELKRDFVIVKRKFVNTFRVQIYKQKIHCANNFKKFQIRTTL